MSQSRASDLFILRPRRRHVIHESPRRESKLHLSLGYQTVRNLVPSPHNHASSLEQAILAGFSPDLTAGELSRNRLPPFPMVRRGAPRRRPIDSISLRRLDLATHLAGRRIRRNTLRAQLSREFPPPLAQCRPANPASLSNLRRNSTKFLLL
jgi:hypothetical protein